MSETIELPKPKRVYKKKCVTPHTTDGGLVVSPNEPVATPIPEPIAIPEPVVAPVIESVVAPVIKEKKPRSQKQIEAFNRMREAKQKKKQELQTPEPIPEPEPEPEPVIQIQESITKPKRTYKKKEPQQVYIDARTINTAKPETYNEPPIYTPQPKIQEKTFRPYIFV